MKEEKELTGYPSIDRPWLKYYSAQAIESELPKCTIYQYLVKQSKNNLDKIAINYFGAKISYRELINNIEMVAKAFYSWGIREGECVTMCTLNTPEMVYCVYALNKLGAYADFEYPTLSERDMYEIISNNKSKVFIVLSLFQEKYKDADQYAEKVIVVSPNDSMPLLKKVAYGFQNMKRRNKNRNVYNFGKFLENGKQSNRKVEENNNPELPALMLHTGGTTGVPKGVLLSSNSFNAIAYEYSVSGMAYCSGDSILHGIPPFHAYGFGVGVHMPLILGLMIHMCIKVDSESIADLFYKVKPIFFVGGAAHTLAIVNKIKIEKFDLSHMKVWAVGGSSLNEKQEKEINEFLDNHNCGTKVITGYGMTELCATSCTERDDCKKAGSVGIPLPHVNVKIMNEDTSKELGYNEPGCLYVHSPGMMLEYKDNEEETRNTIVRDEKGDLWLKTGDLAEIDDNGFIKIVGRIKRIYPTKISGLMYKIFPDYIEDIVMKFPGVEACAVVCRPDEEKIHVPILYIVKNDINTNEKDIREYCINQLLEHCVPAFIYFLEELPVTVVGKIDYLKLENMKTREEK